MIEVRFAVERTEDDHVVKTVDELRTEELLDLTHETLSCRRNPASHPDDRIRRTNHLDDVGPDVRVMITTVLRKSTLRPNDR